jgi:hypothetical protein
MSPRVLARTSSSVAALLVASLVAASAPGKPPDDPRQKRASDLADSADVLFERGQWDAALEQFRNATSVMPSPVIALFEARCLVKLGRLVEADEAYRRVENFTLPPNATEASRRAIVSGREEGGVMRSRIPRLTLTFDADARDTVEVRIDGRPVAPSTFETEQPIDPGVHRLEASKKGETSIWAAETFTLKEGERRSVGVRPKLVAVALLVPPPAAAARAGSARRSGQDAPNARLPRGGGRGRRARHGADGGARHGRKERSAGRRLSEQRVSTRRAWRSRHFPHGSYGFDGGLHRRGRGDRAGCVAGVVGPQAHAGDDDDRVRRARPSRAEGLVLSATGRWQRLGPFVVSCALVACSAFVSDDFSKGDGAAAGGGPGQSGAAGAAGETLAGAGGDPGTAGAPVDPVGAGGMPPDPSRSHGDGPDGDGTHGHGRCDVRPPDARVLSAVLPGRAASTASAISPAWASVRAEIATSSSALRGMRATSSARKKKPVNARGSLVRLARRARSRARATRPAKEPI